jgi:4-hydroxy-tetrahydrodipicolinate synthase
MSTALDLKGIIPATILPMTADGEIDESELRKYIRWIAGQGIKAVAVNVDTGEGPHLWHDEKLRVLRIYKEELAGTKIQIVAGLGASFTAQAVKYGMDYREAGADALLIFPISAYLGHPLPSEIPQVEAIKEALFDAKRFREIAALVRGASRPVTILTGNDNFIWESYLLGADGGLLGACATCTRTHVQVHEAARKGDWKTARELGDRIQKVVDALFAAPVRDYRARSKEVLVIQGILKHAYMRPPLQPVSLEERQTLKKVLEEAGEL